MSSNSIVRKWLDISEKFGSITRELHPVEFFFFSFSENTSSDLSIDLHKLGYEVYGIRESENQRWSVTGVTPPMSVEGNHFTAWADIMDALADSHKSLFDGWGMLIRKPE